MSISLPLNTGNTQVNSSTAKHVIWEGYALKKGGARGGFKNWKKRWIRIDGQELRYYKSRPSVKTLTSNGDDETSGIGSRTAASNSPMHPTGAGRWRHSFIEPTRDHLLLGVLPLKDANVLLHYPENQMPFDVIPWKLNNVMEADSDTTKKVSCYECKRELSSNSPWPPHFCRQCGQVCCSSCSLRQRPLPMQGMPQPVRVCNRCYEVGPDEHVSPSDQVMSVINLIGDAKKGAKPHLFAVKTAERELWLSATTASEQAEMVAVITSAVLEIRRFEERRKDKTKGGKKTDTKYISQFTEQDSSQDSHNKRQLLDRIWEIDYAELTILKKVGEGAFGTVYHAHLWGTDVAVKKIRAERMSSADLEEIQNEIAILSQLRHPNVVLYIGACLRPPNVCIITEWCDRGSLYDCIHNSETPLDTRTMVRYAMGIAQGINYLHSLNQRIIHRDLKTRNVLVTKEGVVKVADFGLSHIRESHAPSEQSKANSGVTRGFPNRKFASKQKSTSSVISEDIVDDPDLLVDDEADVDAHATIAGTPEYMAPEMLEGAKYNQSVDVYSYGMVLSELVSRQLPFRDRYHIQTYEDVLDAVLEEGASPTIPSWCDGELANLISNCVSRNPLERPSFIQIILQLRSIYSGENQGPSYLFKKYDWPRIQSMLSGPDTSAQLRALKEIQQLGTEKRGCSQPSCGYQPPKFEWLKRTHIVDLIPTTIQLMLSSQETIVYHAILALQAMFLSRTQSDESESDAEIEVLDEDTKKKDSIEQAIPSALNQRKRFGTITQLESQSLYIEAIREHGGLVRLSAYTHSTSISSQIKTAACQLLAHLVAARPENPKDDRANLLLGLSHSTLDALMPLLRQRANELSTEIATVQSQLLRKKELYTSLQNSRDHERNGSADEEQAASMRRGKSSSQEVVSSDAIYEPQSLERWRDEPIRCRGPVQVLVRPNSPLAALNPEGPPADTTAAEPIATWVTAYMILTERRLLAFLCRMDAISNTCDPINVMQLSDSHGNVVRYRMGRKKGRHNCLQLAVPAEMIVENQKDNNGVQVWNRLFFNVESREILSRWSRHMGHLVQQFGRKASGIRPQQNNGNYRGIDVNAAPNKN